MERRHRWIGWKPWRRQRQGDDTALGVLVLMLLAIGLFVLIATGEVRRRMRETQLGALDRPSFSQAAGAERPRGR